ncbi:MAG: mechanosensitive ion channel [Gammaproteobacteria bacterium]|nr:mechanosensitive ion channel [Gammaproteobacteria bacterium]MCP5137577.1 mechanosensitive ion channel [Gammaproteobacteria bacterium]
MWDGMPEGVALSAFQAGAALLVGLILHRLVRAALLRASAAGVLDDQLRHVINLAVKVLLGIAVLLLTLGAFGISIQAFWAALSAILVLVAVGFVAVWSVLSNVLCSVLLITLAPFRIGDEIEIQDPASPVTLRGRVSGINIMFTTLRWQAPDEEGEVITRVPNSILFQKYIHRRPGQHTKSLKTYVAAKHQDRAGSDAVPPDGKSG